MFPADATELPDTAQILKQAAEAAALVEELSTALRTISPDASGHRALQVVRDLRHRLEVLKAAVPSDEPQPTVEAQGATMPHLGSRILEGTGCLSHAAHRLPLSNLVVCQSPMEGSV